MDIWRPGVPLEYGGEGWSASLLDCLRSSTQTGRSHCSLADVQNCLSGHSAMAPFEKAVNTFCRLSMHEQEFKYCAHEL